MNLWTRRPEPPRESFPPPRHTFNTAKADLATVLGFEQLSAFLRRSGVPKRSADRIAFATTLRIAGFSYEDVWSIVDARLPRKQEDTQWQRS